MADLQLQGGRQRRVSGQPGKWRTVTGTFWAAAKFARPFTPDTLADDLPDDPTDWEHWETWDVGHRTRQSAIDAALNWEPSKL